MPWLWLLLILPAVGLYLSLRAASRTPGPEVRRFARDDWYFAVTDATQGNRDGRYRILAWCKRSGPTTATNPVWEPGEIWYEFGATEDEAVERLWREVQGLARPRR